jgi:exodeoxyribonuclease VII small subunit
LSEAPTPDKFEDVLAQLEKTIELLAVGTAPLDELVAAHQRALRLLDEAQRRLVDLKHKAESLSSELRA